MKTRSKDNILKKKDGTLVCAYCLSTIKIEHEIELEEQYDKKLNKDIKDITLKNELELRAKLKVLKKRYKMI